MQQLIVPGSAPVWRPGLILPTRYKKKKKHAAVAFDGTNAANSAGGATLTFTLTPSPSSTPSAIVFGLYWFNSDTTITAFTYGGAAVTQLITATDATADVCRIYAISNPASGAQTVSLTFGGSASFFGAVGAVAVTGSDTSAAVTTWSVNSAIGTDAAPIVTVTSATGELVLGVAGQDPCVTMTTDASEIERWNLPSGGLDTAGSTKAGASPNVTMARSCTATGSWAMCAVSVKAAAGQAVVATGTLFQLM